MATSGLGIREAVRTEHLIQAIAVTLDTSPRTTIRSNLLTLTVRNWLTLDKKL